MSNISGAKKNVFSFTEYILIILIYSFVSLIFFFFYQYSVQQDLISYISISEKYLSGEFYQAINGVWGPFISWLLVPFIYFSKNPIVIFKLLQIFIGAVTLLATIILTNQFKFNNSIRRIIVYPSILITTFYVFLTGTPDLLFACITIYLIVTLIKSDYSKISFGFYSGTIGVLLYFAKPFGFPFFIVYYILSNIFIYSKNKNISRITLFRNSVIGLTVFLILSSPWIFLLSTKYQKLTFSTGGEYNFAIIGPQYNGVHIPRIEKLYEPVNQSAVSYWEDPSFLIAEMWSPFDSIHSFTHLLKRLFSNIIQILILLLKFSPLILLLLFLIYPNNVLKKSNIQFIVITSLIYLASISLLFVHQRFLIFVHLILLIFTGLCLAQLFNKYNFATRYKSIIFSLIFISFAFPPAYTLLNHLNLGKDVYKMSEILNNKYGVVGNFASISNKPLDNDWGNTLAISYLLRSKYFGEISPELPEDKMYNELNKYKISYLFLWDLNLKLNEDYYSKISVMDIKEFYPIIGDLNSKRVSVYRVK